MEDAAQTRVFIVEDSPSVRRCLVDLVDSIDGACVVGEADTPIQAIAGIRRTGPDCVILDFQLIGGTAVDVLRALRRESPAMAFIVLTNHPDPQYRRLCINAGAGWFFDKSTEFARIKDVIAGLGTTQQQRSSTDSRP